MIANVCIINYKNNRNIINKPKHKQNCLDLHCCLNSFLSFWSHMFHQIWMSQPKLQFFFLFACNYLCCFLFLWIEDVDDDNDDKILSWTKKCLKEGHVVAVPTDTIYGLACLAQNSEAIRKIYDIKGRNQQKPLAICVGQIQDVYKWVFVPLYARFCSKYLLCFEIVNIIYFVYWSKYKTYYNDTSILNCSSTWTCLVFMCSYCKVLVQKSLLHDLLPGPVTLVFERSDVLNTDLNPFTSVCLL